MLPGSDEPKSPANLMRRPWRPDNAASSSPVHPVGRYEYEPRVHGSRLQWVAMPSL
jgi:hypothetical protein